MGRPKYPDPEPQAEVARHGDGVEQDCWDHLRHHLASRVSIGQAHGFTVEVSNEWLRLNSTSSPCRERIELLRRFAVARGARERDAERVIEHARTLVADGSWRAAQDRRDEMRVKLSLGAA